MTRVKMSGLGDYAELCSLLLPCPFCGTAPRVIEQNAEANHTGQGIVIECDNPLHCGVLVKTGSASRWTAIKRWNTRALSANAVSVSGETTE